jgi:hypothetical protein
MKNMHDDEQGGTATAAPEPAEAPTGTDNGGA